MVNKIEKKKFNEQKIARSSSTKNLNVEQLEAVRYQGGPLLIIAGAGTGKTTVITERIKFLIEKELAKPSEILALTFTEKASREMQERVDVALPYGYTQMWISTFHSFCDRVLRDEALHIGLNPRFKLMTQAESTQLVRDNLFKFDLDYFRPLGNPTKFVGGMLQHFSRLQDEDVIPAQYLGWVRSQKLKVKSQKLSDGKKQELKKWEELSQSYRKYDELKAKEGLMDFGDLIVKTLQLFRDRKNVLKEYKQKFRYVLVDEFQDTNIAQNELAMLLAGKGKRSQITVTGDDDQSIYRFRGAAVSNIIQFRKVYPKAKVIVLTKNYRSQQEILEKAYELIKHNNPDRLEAVENVDKRLKSAISKKREEIGFMHLDRVENEAEAVAKEVSKLTTSSNRSSVISHQYKDIAVLVRANNHAESFIRAFQRHSLPYQFLGPGQLFKQPEIVDLISYLRVLNDFEDSVSLYRLLSMNYFDISVKDLARIGNYSRRYNMCLFDACEKLDDIYVSVKTKTEIRKIIRLIERHLKLARRETAGQLLYYFLEETGLVRKLLNPDTVDAEKKVANVSRFFDKLKTYEVDHEDATVTAVVDWIELSSELGESPLAADIDWTEVNAVNILTVHSSKGLEFPVVFLVNLVSQRFPTIERREQIPIPEDLIKEVLPKGDYHEQEERRLFYVGMTRARDRLYFTAADYYGEGKREKRLSPFIFEALGDTAISAELKTEDSTQLSFLDYSLSDNRQLTTDNRQLTTDIHIDYLSYSQIETFRICPLHYRLRYIYKVPTPPSAALSFGSTIHAAMKEFYQQVKQGKQPTKRLMTKLLEENWQKEGYKNKSHEMKMLERGKQYLSDYLIQEFSPKQLPELLEQNFVVPLDTKYNIQDTRDLKIGGKIDRVDVAKDGTIEVIDYKTGANVPTQKQIDHDLQLTFYALAVTSIKEPPFGVDPDKVQLTLYYFDNQEKMTTVRINEQLVEAVKEIFDWRKKIESSDFTCSGHFLCQNCEYKLFCNT